MYEAQPFQNNIISFLKKNYKKVKTIGFIHATQPNPVHLYYNRYSPDYAVVRTRDQYYHLTKHLKWPKKN